MKGFSFQNLWNKTKIMFVGTDGTSTITRDDSNVDLGALDFHSGENRMMRVSETFSEIDTNLFSFPKGFMRFGNSVMYHRTVTIANDSVFTINKIKLYGGTLIVSDSVVESSSTIYMKSTYSSANYVKKMFTGDNNYGIDVDTIENTVLTGTTGLDNYLTISSKEDGIDASTIYFENRLGTTRTLSIFITGKGFWNNLEE